MSPADQRGIVPPDRNGLVTLRSTSTSMLACKPVTFGVVPALACSFGDRLRLLQEVGGFFIGPFQVTGHRPADRDSRASTMRSLSPAIGRCRGEGKRSPALCVHPGPAPTRATCGPATNSRALAGSASFRMGAPRLQCPSRCPISSLCTRSSTNRRHEQRMAAALLMNESRKRRAARD
jgi:hypothetical protein